jgi:3-oxoacyl-[acyl-carrier-protein] synthase-3
VACGNRVVEMHLPIRIEGTGAAVPATISLSSDLDRQIGRPPGWLFRRTGVFARHVCGGEDQVDLAVSASREALAAAEASAGDIDIVLFAAAVPYQSIPATAPLIQHRLGMADGACAAFDINATCLSFLTAMDILSALIAAGRYRRGLVVASEIPSRALPWTEAPQTAALFGDGAAAAVISAGDGRSGIVAAAMQTHPSAYDACRLGSGGTRYDYHRDREEFARHAVFEMDGETLFRTTLRSFPAFLDRLLAQAGWGRGDVDVVVPHQASPGTLAHLARRSGFRPDVVVDIARDLGNQVAASLPTALHRARRDGRLGEGRRALLLGTSAGISFGGLALVT